MEKRTAKVSKNSQEAENWPPTFTICNPFLQIVNVHCSESQYYALKNEELCSVDQLVQSLGPVFGSQASHYIQLTMDISAIPICRFMRVGELSLMYDGKNSEDFLKRQMETGALLTLHLCGIWPQTLYSNFLRLLESDQLISYSYGKLDSSSVSKCSKLSRGGSRELITTETDKSMIS